MDQSVCIQALKDQIRQFCQDRQWDPYHGFKDLVIGAATEAGELLETARFRSPAELDTLLKQENFRTAVADELADVLFFLLRISDRFNIDLSDAMQAKLLKNAKKYPVTPGKAADSHTAKNAFPKE